MSKDMIDLDEYDQAIIKALRNHPGGVRYSQLNKESKKNGKSINVKTFDSHLKYLVAVGAVNKKEEGRSRVFYKLHFSETDEEIRHSIESTHPLLQEAIEMIGKELILLYKSRNEINETLAQELFEKVLFSELVIIKNLLVNGLAFRGAVAVSLSIIRITEHIKDFMILIGRLIHENDETTVFFRPLLLKIAESMVGSKTSND